MFLIDPKGVVVAREVSSIQDKPARDVTIIIFVLGAVHILRNQVMIPLLTGWGLAVESGGQGSHAVGQGGGDGADEGGNQPP